MDQLQPAMVAIASALFLTATAWAQEPPIANEEAVATNTGASNRLIEEIVVTAQKREEKLQDVPISISAFSADALDAKGIEEPKALQLSTPGLQYSVFAGYSLIYIRGVGTDAFIPSADASVATYIDNLYFPFASGLASALGSIERVEVLKGPQGTLFGRNSTGGAINIVLKQPGPDFETSVVASRENYDKTNFRAYTNIPLSEGLAVSVSALNYSEDPYYKLSNSSKAELPQEVSRGYTVKLGWSPTDELSAVFGYRYIHTLGSQSNLLTVVKTKPLGVLLGVIPEDDYHTSEDSPSFSDSITKVASADLKYNAPWLDFRLLLGRQWINTEALTDFDGSNKPLVNFGSPAQFANVKTAEFQVLSNADTWGAEWLSFVGGLYYIDSSAGYNPLYFTVSQDVISYLKNPPANGPLSVLQGLTNPLLSGLQGLLGPGGALIDDGVSLLLHGILDTESTAGFFQTTANLNDALSLTLGGRYQVETRKLAASDTGVANPLNNEPLGPPLLDWTKLKPPKDGKAETSNFSPKAVLDYKFDADRMVYASYSKGFKSGTFNIINIYKQTQYIKPEVTTSYELGLKSTWLDGALRVNAAAFQNEIDDLQVQLVSLLGGGAVRFETAGAARIRGVDVDLLWQVLPEVAPNLVLTLSGAYLDGKYTDFKEGSGFDEDTGLFFDGTIFPTRDFTGNKTVRTPEFSGTAGLSYGFDLGSGTVEMAADVYYNSGFYYSAQNTASAEEKAYEVVNARVGYFYTPWNLRTTVFGKNINKAKYHYMIADLDFGTAGVLAPPETYGVKLQWDF